MDGSGTHIGRLVGREAAPRIMVANRATAVPALGRWQSIGELVERVRSQIRDIDDAVASGRVK